MKSTPSVRKTFRRTKWIIDSKFQWMIILKVVSMLLILCSIFYAWMMRLSASVIQFALGATEFHSDDFIQYVSGKQLELQIQLFVVFVVMSSICAFLLLRESNRIAGPVFQMKRKIKLLRESGQIESIHLRKDDYLK
ncbi:MAG: hypothetical protein EOP04_31455, partial [Proteobacteria bacterium]